MLFGLDAPHRELANDDTSSKPLSKRQKTALLNLPGLHSLEQVRICASDASMPPLLLLDGHYDALPLSLVRSFELALAPLSAPRPHSR